MKKLIALCTALLLATALTGCGKSADESSAPTQADSSSENSTSQEQTTTAEKIVVDPFDKVAYYIPESEINGAGKDRKKYYPNDLLIILDASESPFGSRMSFTYFVESADQNEIIIKARANVDEIEDFLAESDYTVEVTEKTFTIKSDELNTLLISSDLITGDNKTKIIEAMKDCIQSDTGNSSDTEYTLEKLYVKLPEALIQYNVTDRKINSSVHLDNDSFEDKYINKARINIQGALHFGIFGIFKDSENNYYAVSEYRSAVMFKKGIVDEDSISFTAIPYVREQSDYKFPDEQSAYDKLISMHDYESNSFSSENYVVEELPLS